MESTETASSWVVTAASGNYVYASFPVDVIVYFHMQPSTFRFSCLPVSRVECMLQLPSVDIVFSSKRAEEELTKFREFKTTTVQSTCKEVCSTIGLGYPSRVVSPIFAYIYFILTVVERNPASRSLSGHPCRTAREKIRSA